MAHRYEIEGTAKLMTPCLIYYEEIIRANTEKVIAMAGSAKRLWPHVKSHKAGKMVEMLIGYEIDKFKTATIAEAEMTAAAGAHRVILAYPLIGPDVERYIRLAKVYPQTQFFAIGDHAAQLKVLSDECRRHQYLMKVLIDVNMGMNRTGIRMEQLEELYLYAAALPGIEVQGLHCYDGNHNHNDSSVRRTQVAEADQRILDIVKRLRENQVSCELVVAGGTPSFPCHAEVSDWYLSPGTAFITDAGYLMNLPDLNFIPGAILLTRVVSHPAPGMFTLDLGYKGIAADPAGQRGYIVGMEDAVPVLHSEEHWVFKVRDRMAVPEIGTCLYVIPTHICPTSALYPEVLVAVDGRITDVWEVTARNRKITY